MTLLDGVRFKHPVLRVNNRNRNIAFYEKTLGFKLISEENAIAIFSAWENKDASFIIEESPSMRTRAVEGTQKLDIIVVKTPKASDIEALLANGAAAYKVFQGKKGYAFEAISPEGAHFLLHAEDDRSNLVEIGTPQLSPVADFKGLSDYHFESISLNVANKNVSENFYTSMFDNEFPLSLQFVEAQGQDLKADPQTTWDIESLECQIPADYDLKALKERLEKKGCPIYLDSKEKILVLSDPSNIEIWFLK